MPVHPDSDASLLACSCPGGPVHLHSSVVLEPALPRRAALARVVLAARDNGARSPGGSRSRLWLETAKPALSVGAAPTHSQRRWSPPTRWLVTTAHAPGEGHAHPWPATTELAVHGGASWSHTPRQQPSRPRGPSDEHMQSFFTSWGPRVGEKARISYIFSFTQLMLF